MTTNQWKMPPVACPGCGKKNNGATSALGGPEQPRPGDVSFCIYCGAVAVFQDDFSVRSATDDDWRAWPAEFLAKVERAKSIVDEFIRTREEAGGKDG